MIPFAEALKSGKILILDGATGTQLAARGGITGALSNFECPEIVKAVHADYKAAGANIVLANTLTANRIGLEHAGLADRLEEINSVGAKLCREAVGDDCYVAGDMCSTGQFMEPLGDYTEQQFFDNAAEQARILADNGVDLIIIETMTDVRETAIAVRAAKQASGLPVIASISFDSVGDSFRTMMGDTPEKAVRELTEAGADVIGSNCGTIDPFEMSRLLAEMRSHTPPVSPPQRGGCRGGLLSAMPNAGKPELSAGEVTFKLSPEEFAEGVRKCIEAGATLVGGCCGTTPAHIRAIAKESSLA
jgi:5-methyltetrahydrofolate--homocysteine methyltransferase